ncbi:hypothetical protein D3C78_1587230 [compost metagenome]
MNCQPMRTSLTKVSSLRWNSIFGNLTSTRVTIAIKKLAKSRIKMFAIPIIEYSATPINGEIISLVDVASCTIPLACPRYCFGIICAIAAIKAGLWKERAIDPIADVT